ncbi:MAG: endopeptidase La [Clostridia bacterium]|nr:endopeptidase La [Clostridia bacterium]
MPQKNYKNIPVIPMRGRVLFPNTTVSFDAGRLVSLSAVKRASEGDMLILACLQADSSKDEITAQDIATVGTVLKIKQITRLPSNNIRILAEGLHRARVYSFTSEECFLADADEIIPSHGDETLEEAYFRTAKDIMRDIAQSDTHFSKDAASRLERCGDIEEFINVAAHNLNVQDAVKQELLEEEFVPERLRRLEKCLNDELEIIRLERKINAAVRQSIDKNQREYYLREQLKAIHAELGDDEDERLALEDKVKAKKMPQEIEEKALKELARMDKMPSSSPEYTVIRNYIDWLIDLPWTEQTTDTEDLKDAVAILNEDHYGLEKIKERITEYLAVLKLTQSMNAPILCFVGPPGVGKTSIASSVARSLGRKFVRMSLGGLKDEAEIRGHRRTYIGSMPGRIIYALKNAGTINPVFLLDEIDKLSSDMRGDPASALLEVLDPAQNSTFRDRYLEVPYDLSKVLFITTANSVDSIPAPLLDRMELIEISGYTREEKVQIAKRYLIPKRMQANGLKEGDIEISDEALQSVIDGYTMEAGVRTLERRIDGICRKAAVKYAEGEAAGDKVTPENLHDYLGAPRYLRDKDKPKENEVGAATGLAWTAVGGTTLTIEVSAMHGKGDIQLTGKLGDVMKESARAAISYIRSNSEEYGINDDVFDKTDIHIHVPEGATPKDGPSAGITMATAILSAFTKKPVRGDIAMTGEITLLGNVLPIGGLKEKALAAYRRGVKNIIIPRDNEKDLEEVPKDVLQELNFIPVTSVKTVFENAIIGL